MRIFRQQRDPLRLLGKRLVLLALLVLVIAVGSGAWGIYKKQKESDALRQEAETELRDLSARRAQLEEDIANLKTSRGMEEALRTQYQLAKSGEKLIVIVEPPQSEPTQATSSVFSRWFNRMFSR